MPTVVVLAVGWMVWRNLWGVRIVPVTQAQVDAMLDSGLRWHEPKIEGPRLGPKELEQFAHDSRAGAAAAFYRAYARKPNILEFRSQIRASWPLAEELQSACRGKELAIPWSRFDVSGGFTDLKSLSKLLAVQVMLETATKDRTRCFIAVMRLLEWDRFVQRWKCVSPVDVLVKMACSAIDLKAAEEALGSVAFDGEQIRRIYAAIEPPDASAGEFANALRHEFQFEFVPLSHDIATPAELDTVLQPTFYPMALTDDQDSTDLLAGELNWPLTLQKEADLMKIYIANCSKPWTEQDPSADRESARIEKLIPEQPDVRKNDHPLKKWWLKGAYKQKLKALPNGLGLTALTMLGPAVLGGQFVESGFRQRTTSDAVRLFAQLLLYRLLRGRLPASLGELEGLHLPGPPPRDAYGNAPFLYSPTKGIFWSVGPNGVDDGGTSGSNRWRGPDIVWHVP